MAKNKFNELYFDLEKTRGRPRAILNEKGLKLVYDLAKIACTDEEISNILGCDIKTLYTIWNREKYKEFKHKGLSEGMMSIRRALQGAGCAVQRRIRSRQILINQSDRPVSQPQDRRDIAGPPSGKAYHLPL